MSVRLEQTSKLPFQQNNRHLSKGTPRTKRYSHELALKCFTLHIWRRKLNRRNVRNLLLTDALELPTLAVFFVFSSEVGSVTADRRANL